MEESIPFVNLRQDSLILLKKLGFKTSYNELNNAFRDLELEPAPDATGAIQHSMAALECLCRSIENDSKATLGQLMARPSKLIQGPLQSAISKIYGYASNVGRHLTEGGNPNYEDAELIVHLSASFCLCYTRKVLRTEQEIAQARETELERTFAGLALILILTALWGPKSSQQRHPEFAESLLMALSQSLDEQNNALESHP